MFILAPIDKLLIWPTYALSSLIIVLAFFKAPWKAWVSVSTRQHLTWSTLIMLGIFWGYIGVKVNDVLVIHPLLISSAVFLFGIEIALITCAGSLLVTHFIANLPWQNIGFHYLAGVAAPALSTLLVLRTIRRLNIKNLFIYLLGGGFLGSMLSVLIICLFSLCVFGIKGSTLFWPLLDNAYLFLLLMFPEGFCNGAIISSFTVLKPEWVRTYDDQFYLDDNHK